jgi:lysophospholipase L1-like esterase
MRIVMIGDSITESGKFDDPEQLGIGYVRLIHDYLKTAFPTKDREVINKGISGNRIDDLAARWQTDVLDMKPDLLSISIGVNDAWRQLNNPTIKQILPDEFERIYDNLLQQVSGKIVLMEPTVIVEDPTSAGNLKLKPYVAIVNQMAKKYNTLVVPTHQVFLQYLEAGNGYNLTTDGVHMNSTGNMLMATAWLRVVGKYINEG